MQCTNLGKFGQRNEQNKGNLFVATERDEQICGKIGWILPKVGKKYGGYWRIYGGYWRIFGGYTWKSIINRQMFLPENI